MRLENRTAIDTAWLERLVLAVRPGGLGDFTIIYLPGDFPIRYTAGDFLGSADGLTRTARVCVGLSWPEGVVALQGRVTLRTREEFIVHTTAHELFHLVQYDRGEHATHCDPWKCKLERGANAYAARMLRHHRKLPDPAAGLRLNFASVPGDSSPG